jgi:outer membrane protein TolC
MTEEGYRDGRVDLLRLIDAQRARLESRVAEVEAEAAWERALAEVERAAGVRLDRGGPRAP